MFIKKNKKKKNVLFLAINMFSFLHAAEPVEVFNPHAYGSSDHTQGYKLHQGKPQEASQNILKKSDTKGQPAPLLENGYKENPNGANSTTPRVSSSVDRLVDEGLGNSPTTATSYENQLENSLINNRSITPANTYKTDEFDFGQIPGVDTPQKPFLSTQELGKRLDSMQNAIIYGQDTAKGTIGGTIDIQKGIQFLKELSLNFNEYEESRLLNELKKTKIIVEEAIVKSVKENPGKIDLKQLEKVSTDLNAKIASFDERQDVVTNLLSLYAINGESERDQEERGFSQKFVDAVDSFLRKEVDRFEGSDSINTRVKRDILAFKGQLDVLLHDKQRPVGDMVNFLTAELTKLDQKPFDRVAQLDQNQKPKTVQSPFKDSVAVPKKPTAQRPQDAMPKNADTALTDEEKQKQMAEKKITALIEKQALAYADIQKIKKLQKEDKETNTYNKDNLQSWIRESEEIRVKIKNGLTELDKIAEALTPDKIPLKALCNQCKKELEEYLKAIEAQQIKWNAILNPMLHIGTRSDVQKKDPLRSYYQTDEFGFGEIYPTYDHPLKQR